MLCSWCSDNYSEQLLEQVALRISEAVQCLEHNSLYVEVVPIFVGYSTKYLVHSLVLDVSALGQQIFLFYLRQNLFLFLCIGFVYFNLISFL